MTGTLTIAGLGPGDAALVTPEVSAALARRDRRARLCALCRARAGARRLAAASVRQSHGVAARAARRCGSRRKGASVVLVSSGDPGVFAMASAVFEALEAAPRWQELSIRVLPGVTAMLAAAARAGAPLGHDFCAINLSDNLKPWAVIEKRLRLAAEADFAIAIYNPRSASRPEGFARALEVLKEAGCGERIDHLRARGDDAEGADRDAVACRMREPRWPTWRRWSSSAIRRRAASAAGSMRRGARR